MASRRFLIDEREQAAAGSATCRRPSLQLAAGRHFAWAAALAFLIAGSTGLQAQLNGAGAIAGAVPTRYNPPGVQPVDKSMPMKDATGTEDQRVLQMRNAARQLSMLSDAGKLLRLANEFHTEVAASNSNTLTPAQLHKIQQIEKLARKVRNEMAIAVGDSEGGIMPIQSLGLQ